MVTLLTFLIAIDAFVFVTLLVFKLLGIIAWSLIWVFAPIWITTLVVVVIYFVIKWIIEEV